MTRVFISYRRDDSFADAVLIHRVLREAFGSEMLFFDIETLGAGVQFVSNIIEAVTKCDVLIVIIGKQWVEIKDEFGQQRLKNPEDVLRMEISTALKEDKRIIPVLVGGATMPKAEKLPDDLKSLTLRNAIKVEYQTLDYDTNKLISSLEAILNVPAKAKPELLLFNTPKSTIFPPTLEDLSEFFGFTLEELELNRRGKLAPSQEVRIINSAKKDIFLALRLGALGLSLVLLSFFLSQFSAPLSGIFLIVGGFVTFIAFIFLIKGIGILFFKLRVNTAVGMLGYYTNGSMIHIGNTQLVLNNPIQITPKRPRSGLSYCAYHSGGFLLSIEPEL